jgi:hypothetical protein
MKPSDIELFMPPLTACFKHSESECAAALLVWYMQNHGDEWQEVTPRQLGAAMKDAEFEKEPLKSWNKNPFFNPDFFKLGRDGFSTELNGSYNQPMSFTESGLEQLRKSPWNKNKA